MRHITFLLAGALLGALLAGARPASAEGGPSEREAAKAAEAEARKQAQELAERLASKEVAVREAALVAAKTEQHPLVTAALVKALQADLRVHRSSAIEALVARTTAEGKKAAALGLGARLAHLKAPEQQEELIEVCTALGRLAQVASLKALEDGVKVDTPEAEFRARVMAIARVPDPKAIDLLIDLRARSGNRAANEENRGAWLCRQALAAALGQDLGGDTDRWRAWWRENRETFDFAAAAAARDAQDEKQAQREAKRAERKTSKP